MRIETGHIWIDEEDMGPDFCLLAYDFREVIAKATHDGDFKLLYGHIFSVRKSGEAREWYEDEILADDESEKNDAWMVSAVVEDQDQDLNQNKYVNLENQIQKERNAKYIIFRSTGLNRQVGLKIAVNNHFLSAFYLRVFTNVLSIWLGIGLAAAI